MKSQKGQSLIEVIFAVLVMGLTLTGVVALLSSSLAQINRGFNRQKASDVGRNVMEELVAQKRSDPDAFWQLVEVENQTLAGFGDYVYSVNYTLVGDVTGCTVAGRECVQAYIRVRPAGAENEDEQVTLTRFFSRTN